MADLLHSAAGDPLDAAEAERVFAEVWSRVQADVARGGGVVEDDFERRRLDVIAKAQVASRRRRQLVRGVSLTTAVVLAGGGVAAAADFIAARTGERTTGWEVDAAGPGEVLNAGGTDYPQVLREITADIPFAPGWEHERDVALNGFYLAPEAGSSVTEGAVRATVTDYAVCTWAAYWVAADVAANAKARSLATDTLTRSLTWGIVATTGPHPGPTGPDDVRGQTRFEYLPAIVGAAQAGDRRRMLMALEDSTRASIACTDPELSPGADTVSGNGPTP